MSDPEREGQDQYIADLEAFDEIKACGYIQIDTERSTYLFDLKNMLYCRAPKEDVKRVYEERLEQELSGGPMDDGIWNALREVHFCLYPGYDDISLNVMYANSVRGIITSPLTDDMIIKACQVVDFFE